MPLHLGTSIKGTILLHVIMVHLGTELTSLAILNSSMLCVPPKLGQLNNL